MVLNSEISAEELKVFMAEAEEHIQLLDEDIVKLENEQDNPQLLQEIFRSAHTLKGSSAMLGHERMAEVTHAMESLLDKLRNKKISVNSQLIDALLFGIDALKVLKEEINSMEESDIDILAIVEQINKAADNSNGSSDNGGVDLKKNGEKKTGKLFTINKNAEKKIQDSLKKGLNACIVKVFINKSSEWLAVRSLQVINEMTILGEVIVSQPALKDIEEEKADSQLIAIVCCPRRPEEVQAAIQPIADIDKVIVAPYGSEEGKALLNVEEVEEKQAVEQDNGHKSENKVDLKSIAGSNKAETMQSIRVDVKVLDNLMNMVEELVIDRSRISQVGKMLETRYPDDDLVGDLGDTSNHIIKVINELYQDIMKVRMVPISLVFSKFPRMVRDLAQKQHKNLDFIVKGESTELDRTIIEKIHDPLIHLLRNAVDHGIELPEDRRAKGKPEKAILRLSAYQEEGHIVITLEDDGRGIDAQKVRESAVKKGFASADMAAKMQDSEAIDLIFTPGMSTAEKTTDVSGRGVGLDIVRTNIERLNGTVTLSTKVNVGTVFTIKMPLTVAVFQGLIVSVHGASYIVPLVSVMETIKIKLGDIKTIRGKEVMLLRDSIVPILRMNKVLGVRGKNGHVREEEYVLVVRAGDKTAGIIVDELKEQQEFVIKSLGKYLGDLKGIAGATILGDGKVALILDIPTIIRMVIHQEHYAKKVEAGSAS